jgi:hypothetical protein
MKNPHTPESSLFDVEPRARRDISLAVARGALKIAALTALIGRRVVGAILGLLVAIAVTILCLGGHAALAGDAVPEAGRGMEAVGLVFSYYLEIFGGRVVLNDTAEPPWSEAVLLSGDGKTALHVTLRPGTVCTYDLARVRIDRRGEVDLSQPVPLGFIAFDRLSDETRTRAYQPFPSHGFTPIWWYEFSVPGRAGAVCMTGGCSDRLQFTFHFEHHLQTMRRALRFIFSNVCAPATLPFQQGTPK